MITTYDEYLAHQVVLSCTDHDTVFDSLLYEVQDYILGNALEDPVYYLQTVSWSHSLVSLVTAETEEISALLASDLIAVIQDITQGTDAYIMVNTTTGIRLTEAYTLKFLRSYNTIVNGVLHDTT